MTAFIRPAALTLAMTLAMLLPPPGPAHAQGSGSEPYELVRTLRIVQDRMARGDAGAQTSQRAQLAHIAEQFAEVEQVKWQDPKNARAAVTFVLSGGQPRVLRNLLGLSVRVGLDEKLLKGAVAYGEGRLGDAAELLAGIDPRTLDASIAGHVALVQAELVARKHPLKALVYLDEARLLAPGTLVEEAALRREATILAAAGSFERFEALSLQYLRRFPKSVYAGSFRQQFAGEFAASNSADDAGRLSRLATVLASLDAADRRDVFLAIAREGIAKGKVELVRVAAGHAARLAEEGSAEIERLKVYEGAALIVTEAYEQGLSTLQSVDKSALGTSDAELLDAALSLADQVRRAPAETAGAPPGDSGTATTGKTVELARKIILEVDDMLSGGSK